jgi:hypothetical protein
MLEYWICKPTMQQKWGMVRFCKKHVEFAKDFISYSSCRGVPSLDHTLRSPPIAGSRFSCALSLPPQPNDCFELV